MFSAFVLIGVHLRLSVDGIKTEISVDGCG
jgi:hypothetical protein